MGDALGLANLGIKSIRDIEIPIFHQGLHDALQPVFKILGEEFPDHKLIVTCSGAELIRETSEGSLFSDKMIDVMKSETYSNFIDALLNAAMPVTNEFIENIKIPDPAEP